ncbi:MAG: hypothetical protein ACOX5J_14200 [Candidatus Hydrogenedentales bacterium]|jgi:hypothetical protein
MSRYAGSALGAILLLAGAFFFFLNLSDESGTPQFFGEMWLPLDVASRLVLRPASPEIEDPGSSQLNSVPLAGQEVMTLFPEAPPRLSNLQQTYETAQLPFSVTLKAVEYEAGEVIPAHLTLSDRDGERMRPFHPGESIDLAGQTYVMREIRPWGGILSEPPESGGTPLAVLALREKGGPWSEDIVVQHGDWLQLSPELAFHFLWVNSEDEALETFASEAPGLASAKWGIQESGVMHWFDSFLIGSGLELDDGTVVTLAEVRGATPGEMPEDAVLCVRVERNGTIHEVWVPANRSSEDGLVRFSYPALAPYVLRGCAWEDGAMRFGFYRSGEAVGGAALKLGDIAPLDTSSFELRLDQVLESAVYLRREDSPLQEVVLEGEGRILRFRQGETVLLRGCTVEFQPRSQDLAPVYALEIAQDFETQSLLLQRDTVAKAGNWTLQQAAGAGLSEDWATLYLESTEPRAWHWVPYALGAAGVIAVAAGFVPLPGPRRRGKIAGPRDF